MRTQIFGILLNQVQFLLAIFYWSRIVLITFFEDNIRFFITFPTGWHNLIWILSIHTNIRYLICTKPKSHAIASFLRWLTSFTLIERCDRNQLASESMTQFLFNLFKWIEFWCCDIWKVFSFVRYLNILAKN